MAHPFPIDITHNSFALSSFISQTFFLYTFFSIYFNLLPILLSIDFVHIRLCSQLDAFISWMNERTKERMYHKSYFDLGFCGFSHLFASLGLLILTLSANYIVFALANHCLSLSSTDPLFDQLCRSSTLYGVWMNLHIDSRLVYRNNQVSGYLWLHIIRAHLSMLIWLIRLAALLFSDSS